MKPRQSKSQDMHSKSIKKKRFIIPYCDSSRTLILALLISAFLLCISLVICAVCEELLLIFYFLCMSQGMILKWMAWLTLRSWEWLPKKFATLDEWPPSTWTRPSCSGPGRTLNLQPDGRLLLLNLLWTWQIIMLWNIIQLTMVQSRSLHHACVLQLLLLTNVPSASCFLFTYFCHMMCTKLLSKCVFVELCHVLLVLPFDFFFFQMGLWWNCFLRVILVVFPFLSFVSFSLLFTRPPLPSMLLSVHGAHPLGRRNGEA